MLCIAIIDHVGNKAGMDYYDSSLMRGLYHKGCKVTIYSNYTGLDPRSITYKHYYDGHSDDGSVTKLYKLLRATFQASYDARKENTDLVIVHLFSAGITTFFMSLIPKLFGLKIAIISHDVSSFANNDNSFIKNFIYNTLTDHIIVHNQFSYDTLMNGIDIKDPEKVTIIKHGGYLDYIVERPEKEYVRGELGLEKDGKYILFFGQIKKVKGLDVLLEALSMVPDDIKLIIAGKPWKADFSAYNQLIEKYKLQNRVVKMIHFIEDEEREKLFFAADVNVLPYRIIYQSGVLLMAMSHGLPVIASDLPPNKEIIIHNENGMLFESENAKDLAEQIIQYFENDSLRRLLAENSTQTIVDHYSWDDIANNYIKIIKKDQDKS